MNKLILPIILGMFLLISVSAIYAGETYTHDFSNPIINCSIINNTYNLEGLNLSWSDSIAKIDTQINYQPDNFSLVCWINQTTYEQEVIVSSGGSSHKNRKNTINTTNLTNETSNITLEEWNYTAPIEETPIITEPIKEIPKEEPIINQTIDKGGKMIEQKTIMWGIGIIIFILVLVVIILSIRKKNKDKDEDYNHEEIVKEVEEKVFPKKEVIEDSKKSITSVDDILKLNKK